jgi:hypothetical protein
MHKRLRPRLSSLLELVTPSENISLYLSEELLKL